MKTLTKSVLIPVAAFAVTVTGVSAFNETVLEDAGLSDTQIEAFAEAHELRQAGEYDDAKEVLEDAGIDRATMQEVRSALREYKAEVRAVIESALEGEDYNAFMDAIAGTPLEDKIEDEDDFDLFLEAYELKESGYYEEAKEILNELGIEKPERKHGLRNRLNAGERLERVN